MRKFLTLADFCASCVTAGLWHCQRLAQEPIPKQEVHPQRLKAALKSLQLPQDDDVDLCDELVEPHTRLGYTLQL
jgi:hypothetical protein